MEAILTMPPEIAGPVVDVCSAVKKAVKEHVNKHGGYKYVSIDKFYEDMGPLLADAGLILMMNERSAESDGKWLNVSFDFYIYHKSGKQYGPVTRSQGVLANGPQAYAAAQSFAEKYFMRQLFKIPTGEEDADGDSQSNKQAIPAKAKPAPVELMAVADSARERDTLLASLSLCTSTDAMLTWIEKTAKLRERMHKADVVVLQDAYRDQQATIKGKAA
jgi:hypothetical protein